MTTPKSRAGRRTALFGDVAAASLEEQYASSNHRQPESIVFSHRALGTPLDPSKLSRFARKALDRAGIDKPFRVWHGLRHTALTETAAAGVPGFLGSSFKPKPATPREDAAKTNYPDLGSLDEGSAVRIRHARVDDAPCGDGYKMGTT